jgi:L-fuconolactonase
LCRRRTPSRDTELLLDIADQHAWVAGVVGWVQLDDPAVAVGQLDRWQQHPAFCGVRHLVHDDERDDFLSLPTVRRSLSALAERDVTFDVPDRVAASPRRDGAVAAAVPELRVVVDHLGKPPFGRDDWAQWRRVLAEVAARPNVTAKVSGLQTPGRLMTVDGLRPAWDTALELFGPRRLMWGSDWPMTPAHGGLPGARGPSCRH